MTNACPVCHTIFWNLPEVTNFFLELGYSQYNNTLPQQNNDALKKLLESQYQQECCKLYLCQLAILRPYAAATPTSLTHALVQTKLPPLHPLKNPD